MASALVTVAGFHLLGEALEMGLSLVESELAKELRPEQDSATAVTASLQFSRDNDLGNCKTRPFQTLFLNYYPMNFSVGFQYSLLL